MEINTKVSTEMANFTGKESIFGQTDHATKDNLPKAQETAKEVGNQPRQMLIYT